MSPSGRNVSSDVYGKCFNRIQFFSLQVECQTMQLSRHWRRLAIALVVIHGTDSVVHDSSGSVPLLEAVGVED